MKRQQTKKELVERVQELSTENTLFLQTLHDLVLTQPKWNKAGPYRWTLLRPNSPCGGIVVLRWHCKGQSDTVTVYNVDNFIQCYKPSSYGHNDSYLCQIVDQVQVLRQKFWDEVESLRQKVWDHKEDVTQVMSH